MICIVAFLGFYTVATDIYYETFHINKNTKLLYEPYVYCFISYFLLFYPLRNLNIKRLDVNFMFKKYGKMFVMIWTLFYTFFTLLKVYETIGGLALGLGASYEARHIDGDTLFRYNNYFFDYIVNGYGLMFYNASYPIILLYAILGFAQNKLRYKFSLYLILICILPAFLIGISSGSRGYLFMFVMCDIFLLSLFWPGIPSSLKMSLKKYSLIIAMVLVSISLIITIERLGDSKDGGVSILRYFGESFPNLGYLMYDQVAIHPMGIRFYPEILWGNNPPWFSTDDSYQYWGRITGVPVISFKTFFGDFYIEFGLEITILLLILLYILISYVIRKRFSIITLPIVFLYMRMCSQSFAGFTLVNHTSIFQLEITLLLMIILIILKRLSVRTKCPQPFKAEYSSK